MKKVEKLNDVSLAEVSGGVKLSGYGVALAAGAGAAVVGGATDFGCTMASLICQYRAKANRKNGNTERAEKLEKAGRVLTDISFASKPVALAGAVVAVGSYMIGAMNGLSAVQNAVQNAVDQPGVDVVGIYDDGMKNLFVGPNN